MHTEEENECKRVGCTNKVAYKGAEYCGAACSEMRNIPKTQEMKVRVGHFDFKPKKTDELAVDRATEPSKPSVTLVHVSDRGTRYLGEASGEDEVREILSDTRLYDRRK